MGSVIQRRDRGGAGRRVRWLVGAVVGLVLAGCSSSASSSSNQPTDGGFSPPPLSSSGSSVSEVDVAKQQATEAYLGMWRDMEAAATSSDWQAPRLAQHATADALPVITNSLRTDSQRGVVTKGQLKNYPQVTTVDPPSTPTTVLIKDCSDSSNWLKYRVDNGQLVDNKPGGRQAITAEVKKQTDGAWRVTRFAVEGVGSCS